MDNFDKNEDEKHFKLILLTCKLSTDFNDIVFFNLLSLPINAGDNYIDNKNYILKRNKNFNIQSLYKNQNIFKKILYYIENNKIIDNYDDELYKLIPNNKEKFKEIFNLVINVNDKCDNSIFNLHYK